MLAQKVKILAVLPVFNEEETVIQVLRKTIRHVDYTIIINDGSTDNSEELILNYIKEQNNIVLIRNDRNEGMAQALAKGFYFAYYLLQKNILSDDDIIINIDTDGQHNPDFITGMVHYLKEHSYDVVLGCRDLKKHYWYKRFGNYFLTFFASISSGFKYNDVECGYRLLRAGTLPGLISYYAGKKYSCAQEIGIILPRLGFRVCNNYKIDIPFYRKRGTQTKDGVIIMLQSFMTFIRLVLRLPKNKVKVIKYKVSKTLKSIVHSGLKGI